MFKNKKEVANIFFTTFTADEQIKCFYILIMIIWIFLSPQIFLRGEKKSCKTSAKGFFKHLLKPGFFSDIILTESFDRLRFQEIASFF